jgi:hypothetical protein
MAFYGNVGGRFMATAMALSGLLKPEEGRAILRKLYPTMVFYIRALIASRFL